MAVCRESLRDREVAIGAVRNHRLTRLETEHQPPPS